MATLSQLRDAVNRMISEQGEDAPCAYWVYSKEDAYIIYEGDEYNYIYDKGKLQAEDVTEAVTNALEELIDIDYVYTVIQECLDELVEEKVNVKIARKSTGSRH